MHKTSLRPMSAADVMAVAAIHAESWDPCEISVKLGKRFLEECFYSPIVGSPHAFGYVFEHEGVIVGYATGFLDYEAFNKVALSNKRLRAGWEVMKSLLKFRLGLRDIIAIAHDSKKTQGLKYARHHLGALALASEYKGTDIGKEAITSVINRVLSQLHESGCDGCWGICDAKNIPMVKYLHKLGFECSKEYDQGRRRIRVFERSFGDI